MASTLSKNEDVPLPTSWLTWFLAIIHILWIVGLMWIAVFFIPQKYRWIWITVMLAEFVHWHFSKGECMLSYWEKKAEDPNYNLGDNPELTYAWVILKKWTGVNIIDLRQLHAQITQIVFIWAIADQILVYNPLNLDYPYRIMIFLYALFFTIQYISFDSFNQISNDLEYFPSYLLPEVKQF